MIDYLYKLGSKTSKDGLPVNVKISIDADLKQTVDRSTNAVKFGLTALAIGIVIGAISKKL